MKDLIKQIAVLRRSTQSLILSIMAHPDYTGEENEEWTDLTTIAQDAINELEISYPVSHCKALRKRGTDKWYHFDEFDSDWIETETPDTWKEDDLVLSLMPEDAELIDLTIIVEEGGER